MARGFWAEVSLLLACHCVIRLALSHMPHAKQWFSYHTCSVAVAETTQVSFRSKTSVPILQTARIPFAQRALIGGCL